MAFFGLRKWSTPLGIAMAHSALTFTQVFRPLWPFFAASTITYFLVSKAQDIGVRSDGFRNDARNPYAAQIAKEAHAHH